jgi:hypothetical protein
MAKAGGKRQILGSGQKQAADARSPVQGSVAFLHIKTNASTVDLYHRKNSGPGPFLDGFRVDTIPSGEFFF